MNCRALLCVFILIFARTGSLVAQEDMFFHTQAETMFLLGVRLYTQQEFTGAYEILKQTAELQPLHQRTTAAIVMAAKAANGLGVWQDAMTLCADLLERFPFSSYVEDAQYTNGVALLGIGRGNEAAQQMVSVLNTAQMRITRWRACEYLERIAHHYAVEDIRLLETRCVDDTARVLLMLLRAEAFARAHRVDSASALGRSIMVLTTDKKILKRAQRLVYATNAAHTGDTLTVGVLVPFMHHLKEDVAEHQTADDVVKGIRLALQDFVATAQSSNNPIRLDVRDSQRQKEHIERIIAEWRNDSTVVAILGPLYSDETVAAATVANAAGIPLLSPTANGNDIASIGEYVFQASPDYGMRGSLMAQYAVRTAGVQTFAVLTVDDTPGALLADAFIQEVKRLGAVMISVQRYQKGTSDFRPLLRLIKNDAVAARKGSIQAIYCPIASSAEIGSVTSQIRVFDANIIIFGTDEWNDDEALERARNSAEGVIFPSDRWDSGDTGGISGLSIESFGYDAAAMLLQCIAGSLGTRSSVVNALSHVSLYDGLHSTISLSQRRVNSSLHILQYSNGFIKKISHIDYQK